MLVVFVLTVLLPISAVLSEEKGYYWRDYNGTVPSDAFEAGIDSSGKPIYIGQGFFQNVGLLPGTLRPGSTDLKVTAQAQVFNTNKNVKILCSQHLDSFLWIALKSPAEIPSLTNVHLVGGGYETDTVVNVGRARHEGDLEIGKIYNPEFSKGVGFPNRDGSESNYKNFDILAYDYNRNNTSESVEDETDKEPILLYFNINVQTRKR